MSKKHQTFNSPNHGFLIPRSIRFVGGVVMAYIRTLDNGKYQATVRRNGIRKFKTFSTRKAAN